jgi:hypothetical protein
MKREVMVMIGFILILAFNAYAYDDNDFQVWNTEAEEFKVNKNAKIGLEEEYRWADNANIFYYHHYDIGFFYNLQKYLNIGGGYRHVYELKRGKFKLENEPYLTLSLLWELAGFKFEDRSRAEYRHFDYQDDAWRYRNKFTMKFPWKFTKLEIQPYVSDEVYVAFEETDQLNQNRASAGLGLNLTKNLKAEVYYLLQSSKSRSTGEWSDANVLGTKLKIAF